MSEPLLSILVATTYDRRILFQKLYAELKHQSEGLGVEILFEEDGKQMSIGKKRQKLLERATGDYIVFFDSDDWPLKNYVSELLLAIMEKPDCVGFLILMTTNGKREQTCCHSLQYKDWAEKVDGYDFVRNCTHFNPVRRELALRVGFPDLRHGEDRWYSDRVSRLCKSEVFINKKLFHYRYSNKMNHNVKYGIR